METAGKRPPKKTSPKGAIRRWNPHRASAVIPPPPKRTTFPPWPGGIVTPLPGAKAVSNGRAVQSWVTGAPEDTRYPTAADQEMGGAGDVVTATAPTVGLPEGRRGGTGRVHTRMANLGGRGHNSTAVGNGCGTPKRSDNATRPGKIIVVAETPRWKGTTMWDLTAECGRLVRSLAEFHVTQPLDEHHLLWAGIVVGVCAILFLWVLRRHKFAAVSCVCLAIAVANCALWVWSFRADTTFAINRSLWYSQDPVRIRGDEIGMHSAEGGLSFHYERGDDPDPAASPGESKTTCGLGHSKVSNYPRGGVVFPVHFLEKWPWPELGISAAYGTEPFRPEGATLMEAGLALPHWIVVALLLITPSAWAFRGFRRGRRRHYRVAHNLCLKCGYDLRSQKSGQAGDKCPECGAPIAQKPSPAAPASP